MVKANILLVEDDRNMAFMISENLRAQGFELSICYDGETASKLFGHQTFDLCLLDVMLPKMDGFKLARSIRKTDKRIPIVFLTAKDFLQDKVEGFQAGADDYITKPFNITELILRIEAILKRTGAGARPTANEEMKVGGFVFNYLMRQLFFKERYIKLSAKEAELLNILLEYKNQLLPREIILKKVWGEDNFFTAKSMDVYLTRLRKIIREDNSLELQNVHGIGYRFIVKEGAA